jgi:hypothetical protein
VMYRIRQEGMGTISPTGSVTYPAYCNWPVIGSWFNSSDACRVVTQAEIDATTTAAIQKAAGAGTPAYNPDLAAQQTAAYQGDVAALCASDPAGCEAYKAATVPPAPTNWLLYGGLALAGVAVLSMGRARR